MGLLYLSFSILNSLSARPSCISLSLSLSLFFTFIEMSTPSLVVIAMGLTYPVHVSSSAFFLDGILVSRRYRCVKSRSKCEYNCLITHCFIGMRMIRASLAGLILSRWCSSSVKRSEDEPMAGPSHFLLFLLIGNKDCIVHKHAVGKKTKILCVRRQTNNEPLTNYPHGFARGNRNIPYC